MIAAAALAVGACLLIAAGLAWTARLLHVGMLDALELADKVGTPEPSSAVDWPELRVRSAIKEDIPGERHLVLLHVGWPAHPDVQATLLVDLGGSEQQSLRLLSQWAGDGASISPTCHDAGELELRRRQSLERIHGQLIAEDYDVGHGARSGEQRTPK